MQKSYPHKSREERQVIAVRYLRDQALRQWNRYTREMKVIAIF